MFSTIVLLAVEYLGLSLADLNYVKLIKDR
jgi:hypothetical protein